MTQAGNLLRAAKAKISRPADWHQEGTYVNAQGCLCAQAAINRAFKSSDYNSDVADQATDYLSKTLKDIDLYTYITKYNDDPNTTHADIMNLFDDAAEMADAPTGE
jgi:galactitol-specific phosphotransferase system IIB component